MSKLVKLELYNQQDLLNDKEVIELNTDAKLYYKNEVLYLIFTVDSKDKIQIKYFPAGNKLKIIRYGETSYNLDFIENKFIDSTINTNYGFIKFKLFTYDISVEADQELEAADEIKVDLDYLLVHKNIEPIRNNLNLKVETKEQDLHG